MKRRLLFNMKLFKNVGMLFSRGGAAAAGPEKKLFKYNFLKKLYNLL